MRHFIPAILWTGVILVLCASPGKSIPSIDWLHWVSFDKWVHAFVYLVLFGLIHRGISQSRNVSKNYVFYFLFNTCYCIVLGIGIEILQAMSIPDRSGDVDDAVANIAGVVFAIIGFRIREKKWSWQARENQI